MLFDISFPYINKHKSFWFFFFFVCFLNEVCISISERHKKHLPAAVALLGHNAENNIKKK